MTCPSLADYGHAPCSNGCGAMLPRFLFAQLGEALGELFDFVVVYSLARLAEYAHKGRDLLLRVRVADVAIVGEGQSHSIT